MTVSTEMADGVPEEKGIFRGLAQAPLHFHNLVAELVDNAVAARQHGFEIRVDISGIPGTPDQFAVIVVDNGPGISLKLLKEHVFKTGDPPAKGSPHLNEHGFGLKNVLAKAEALGGSWVIQTRDQDALKHDSFYEVSNPLAFKIPIRIRAVGEWPKYGFDSPSTIVKLQLPLSYLQTVSRGKRGAPPESIPLISRYLREHLGVYYRGYIEGGKKASGSIVTSLNWKGSEDVEEIRPDHSTKIPVKRFSLKTLSGPIEIEGEYGLLESSSEATRKERLYYYRNSPESQGVDMRIGRRVVATRLLSEIWQRARHPSYNAYWGEFRIEPAIPGRIPKTLNNKTSIDFDSEIWGEVAGAILQKVPEPVKGKGTKQEAELRHELWSQLHGHKMDKDVVEEDYPCFSGSGVVIDILRDESKRTGELIIYEAKAGQAHPLDVYQLRLYWDGLAEDGRQPTRGYLVADQKTAGTSTVIRCVNTYKDKNDKPYSFEFKSWKDLNIDT